MIEDIRTKETLIDFVAHGNIPKYLCFWGHTEKHSKGVNKSCFSQWYESAFEVDSFVYSTAEHFMMAEKARLFSNHDLVEEIIVAPHPQKAKQLGRNVEGFSDEVWHLHRFNIVVRGNFAKFSQNQSLGDYLLKTGNRVLVEASPVDKIWGIGLAEDDVDSINPFKWKGLNLLGFALMEVRERLKKSC